MEKCSIFEQVYNLVKKIPKGKVATYGEIAKKCGIKNIQVVGYALHSNKTPETIPCHRIIKKGGLLAGGYAFGGWQIQKEKLEQEGIVFIQNKIDMSIFGWSEF